MSKSIMIESRIGSYYDYDKKKYDYCVSTTDYCTVCIMFRVILLDLMIVVCTGLHGYFIILSCFMVQNKVPYPKYRYV